MMSACVFSTQIESPTSSASFKRAEVEVTSAETHRLERLIVISWSRYEVRGWVFGRSARTVNGWVREQCCGADMMPVVGGFGGRNPCAGRAFSSAIRVSPDVEK